MDIRNPANHLKQLKMQKARLREFMKAVGASEADIQEVTEDAGNLEAILDHTSEVKKFKETIDKIWDVMLHGIKDGEQRPEQPKPPVLVLPYPPAKAGMRIRSETRNRKFKAAPGYTKEIGNALGLEREKSEK